MDDLPAAERANLEKNIFRAPLEEVWAGTRDFFPDEMSVRQQVFARLYAVVESFGYQRYDGPMLEPMELYAAKSSGRNRVCVAEGTTGLPPGMSR